LQPLAVHTQFTVIHYLPPFRVAKTLIADGPFIPGVYRFVVKETSPPVFPRLPLLKPPIGH
jgi:hypothetical protein